MMTPFDASGAFKIVVIKGKAFHRYFCSLNGFLNEFGCCCRCALLRRDDVEVELKLRVRVYLSFGSGLDVT
jgi:hypothetical protein